MRAAVALVLVLGGAAIADPTVVPTKPRPARRAPAPKAPTDNGKRTYAPADAPEPKEMHKEGDYGGVTPGTSARPDPRHQPRPTKGTLSWIGFEAKDGGAELFFQSVAAFDVVQHVEGATVVAYLALPRLGHNTWRQIDTRYFDNPLSGIVARNVGAARASKDHPAHGAGIEVRITFKNAKDARQGTMRNATESDGLYYTYLSFPEGAEQPTVKDPDGPTTSPKDVEN